MIRLTIPKVDPDSVIGDCLIHACPFAKGSTGSERCSLLTKKTERAERWKIVSCPVGIPGKENEAPESCPLRDGPVTIRPAKLEEILE
jgi:hypothetical protein